MKQSSSIRIFDRFKIGQLNIGVFLLLSAITWILGKYAFIGPNSKDNSFVTNSLCTLYTFQTIITYYFFSLHVFPKYLFKFKLIPFLLFLIITFWLAYQSNYVVIKILLPYSNDVVSKSSSEHTFIYKMYFSYLQESQLFGCFTNPVVATWTYGFSLEVATIFLIIKAFKDIISIQKKNLILERDKYALERDNLALELNFLKSQINPHFLFNTLNSIYTRTIDVDEEASDLVLKLSSLMRYGLYGANEEKVALSDEMDYIQNYLDLEKYRHSQSLVDISFAMEGVTAGQHIAPLLLISFVENAFKHGVNLSRKNSFVHVSAVIEDNRLYFNVQNSVPEPTENINRQSAIKNSGGIGLLNTRKRLKMIYPERHEITLQQTEKEYEVMLMIELG